ncbi:MAG: hypothetical protein HY053_08265 [Proteobacteria bacterium]|nr:hypothetical protein [Pseudomonadota bacterium]
MVEPLNEEEKLRAWLAEAYSQVRSAEYSRTLDNLYAFFTSDAYGALSASASSGGFPSLAAFAELSPSRRQTQLRSLIQQPDDMELAMIEFLRGLGEESRPWAENLIKDLMRGNISADLKGRLAELMNDMEREAQAEAAHARESYAELVRLKEQAYPEHAMPLAPVPSRGRRKKTAAAPPVASPEFGPTKPKRHYKQRRTMKEAVEGAEPEGDKQVAGPGD